METHIYPSEKELNALALSEDRWTIHPTEEKLKRMAKSEGLWNLWIPVLFYSWISAVRSFYSFFWSPSFVNVLLNGFWNWFRCFRTSALTSTVIQIEAFRS